MRNIFTVWIRDTINEKKGTSMVAHLDRELFHNKLLHKHWDSPFLGPGSQLLPSLGPVATGQLFYQNCTPFNTLLATWKTDILRDLQHFNRHFAQQSNSWKSADRSDWFNQQSLSCSLESNSDFTHLSAKQKSTHLLALPSCSEVHLHHSQQATASYSSWTCPKTAPSIISL